MYVNPKELTLTEEDIELLVTEICSAGWHDDYAFQSRVNRDVVAAACKQRGAKIKKSSMSSQSLDPRYTVEGRHLPDKGLANDRISVNLYFLERVL